MSNQVLVKVNDLLVQLGAMGVSVSYACPVCRSPSTITGRPYLTPSPSASVGGAVARPTDTVEAITKVMGPGGAAQEVEYARFASLRDANRPLSFESSAERCRRWRDSTVQGSFIASPPYADREELWKLSGLGSRSSSMERC